MEQLARRAARDARHAFGEQLRRGDAVGDRRGPDLPLRADQPLGTYLVSYRIISADSHPVGGAMTFSPAGIPPSEQDYQQLLKLYNQKQTLERQRRFPFS